MLPTNCRSGSRVNFRIPFDVLLISNRCLCVAISLCFLLSLVPPFTLKLSAPFICTLTCFEFRFFYNLCFLPFSFFLFLCIGLCLFTNFRRSLFDTPSLSFSFILLLFCIFSLTHFPWSPLLSISHTISPATVYYTISVSLLSELPLFTSFTRYKWNSSIEYTPRAPSLLVFLRPVFCFPQVAKEVSVHSTEAQKMNRSAGREREGCRGEKEGNLVALSSRAGWPQGNSVAKIE